MKKTFSRALLACMMLFAVTGVCAATAALKPFDADTLPQIVASQRGKPFLLVLWSLDCAYCMASLKTIAQEKKRRHNSFDVVTIATDSIGDPQAVKLMNAELKAVSLTTNAWAFGEAPPEQLRYAIDPTWRGEMPRSYWFESNGRRTGYSGVLSKELLAQKLAQP